MMNAMSLRLFGDKMRFHIGLSIAAAALALAGCSKSDTCTPADLDAKFTEISARADATFGKGSETSKITMSALSAKIAEAKAGGNISPDMCVRLDKMSGTLPAP